MKFLLLLTATLLPSSISAATSFETVRRSPPLAALLGRQLDSCPIGTFACTDGGCCDIGATCATDSDGNQICQSLVGCVAPPVPCGSSCCDAGSTCIMEGTQFRCAEGGLPAAAPTGPVPTGLLTDSIGVPTVSIGEETRSGLGLTTAAAGDPLASLSETGPGALTEVGTATGTQVGTLATASAVSASSSAATRTASSLASKNVMALGSAIVFAAAAWAVVGRF